MSSPGFTSAGYDRQRFFFCRSQIHSTSADGLLGLAARAGRGMSAWPEIYTVTTRRCCYRDVGLVKKLQRFRCGRHHGNARPAGRKSQWENLQAELAGWAGVRMHTGNVIWMQGVVDRQSCKWKAGVAAVVKLSVVFAFSPLFGLGGVQVAPARLHQTNLCELIMLQSE